MIIGLAGEAESGKDAFADVLVSKRKFQKLSFAKNLKEMSINVFGLSEFQVYEQEGKKQPFKQPMVLTPEHIARIDYWIRHHTPKVKVADDGLSKTIIKYWEQRKVLFKNPRELLQFVGTEICRENYSMNYHIDVVKEQIDWEGNTVIADARFKNERGVVREEWNGFTIKVIDPDQEEDKTAGISGHASESEMDGDDFDVVYMNDKSQGLQVLETKVLSILDELKEGVFQKHGGK